VFLMCADFVCMVRVLGLSVSFGFLGVCLAVLIIKRSDVEGTGISGGARLYKSRLDVPA
jgi:hypothetical protein